MKKWLLIVFSLLLQVRSYAQLNTDHIIANGRNALYFHDYVLAIQYFNQVIRAKPFLADPYLLRAITKIQLEDYFGAKLDADKAISINPFLSEAYYTRAYANKKQSDFTQALTDINQAIHYSPQNADYLISRVDIYSLLNDYEKAEEDINVLVNRKPKEKTMLLLEKARLRLLQKDTVGGIVLLDSLTKIAPREANVWAFLGLIQLIQEKNEDALKNYDKAILLNPQNGGYYINRGILNYKQKNYRQALADYDKAVEYEPENILGLFNRALLRSEVGDYNRSMTDLSIILERNPTHSEALYERGIVASKLKNYTVALKDFSSLIQIHPAFLPAYAERAKIYETIGNAKAAYRDRLIAHELEQTQGKSAEKQKRKPQAEAIVAKDNTQEFNLYTARAFNKNETSTYNNEYRGNVQNKYFDIIPEPDFFIGFYISTYKIKPYLYSHLLLEKYNKNIIEKSKQIKLSNKETSLTEEQINTHFANLEYYNDLIKKNPTQADLYYKRGLQYASLQDVENAINDFSMTISLDNNFTLAYYCRATNRAKKLDYIRTTNPETQNDFVVRKNELLLLLSDYNRTIELQADFPFAWYNRANLYASNKEFLKAISDYSEVIRLYPDFAEAYFNRGLIYAFIGENEKGITDLSKAGELGIYQAYNFIKRFTK